MKRLGTSSFYSYSSSSYPNHRGNFALVLEERSKKAKKSAKTHCKIVQRENGRCEICDEIAGKKLQRSSEQQKVKEEKRREVVEENVVVIIDDGKHQKKDLLEEKVEGNVNEEKMVVMVVNGEVDIEKREVLEERVKENNKVEEGKIVIMDDGFGAEALLEEVEKTSYGEGDERNGDGVVVGDVVEENNEDLFSIDIIGEGNLLSGWDEWKYKVEKGWDCSYPIWWESENSDFKTEYSVGNEFINDG